MENIKKLKADYKVTKGEADGTQHDGEITSIDQGTVEEFVENKKAWEGALDQSAIQLHIKVDSGVEMTKLITVPTEGDECSDRSNLGKFISMYGQPVVGLKVKTITKDGFQRLLLI